MVVFKDLIMTQKLSRKQEMLIHSLRQRHGRKDSDLCLCDGLRAGSEILNLRPDLIEWVVLRKGFEAKLEFPVEPVILESGDFVPASRRVGYSSGWCFM